MQTPYRLGIDIGTNSLGWCILDLGREGNPSGIRRLGVRIFTDGRDPQKGTSLAVDRRIARQQRRRRDRLIDRRDRLMKALIRHGLMPAGEAGRKHLQDCDPYRLRAKGLYHPLSLHELGRAIFHLNQRRGFKSNRKTEKSADEKETAGMKGAIRETEARLDEAGAFTLGEYLHREFRAGLGVREQRPVRARRRGVGAKATYDLYPSRAMYEQEFDLLWAVQAALKPGLSETARDEIRGIVFFQRKLKPVDPGRCTLEPDQPRAPVALPLAQQFRMLQELANLKIVGRDQTSRPLDRNQRNRILKKLAKKPKMTFDQVRKAIGLEPDESLNLQSETRTELKGDLTGTVLAPKNRFGLRWRTLTPERQHEIVDRLLRSEDDETVAAMGVRDWGLSPEAATAVTQARLPDGYARLSVNAMGKIVALLCEKGFCGYGYAEAAAEAGYHHSDLRTGEVFDALPFYGEALERRVAFGSGKPEDPPEKRFGRIPNPTVHIGLNQLRKTINAIMALYGPPTEIVVELARELKLSARQKEEIEREQKVNKSKNDDRRKKLAENGLTENGENMMRLRLWEELGPPHDRRCPYTGEPISVERLFSDEVEIEHILPFSRTLDDSAANRTVALRAVNREKRQYTPHEAFSTSPGRYVWDDILLRAGALPRNKSWRFAEDAMVQFEAKNNFLARQLTDTAYLARLTREYLSFVCDPNKVWVIPGRLTALLRGRWGLNRLLSDHNRKERIDHRHHAIDAFVTALTDRAMLKGVSDAAGVARERLIDDMPEPWDGFRDDLRDRLGRCVISFKPEHGIGGRLHEDFAYSVVAEPEKEDGATLAIRKDLTALTPKEVESIRDRRLRESIVATTKTHFADKSALRDALAAFGQQHNIRRVRVLKSEENFIQVQDQSGQSYKALIPGDNNHADIFELANGRWTGRVCSTFDANQSISPVPQSSETFLWRAHKGDLVKLENDGGEGIFRIVQLHAKRLQLAEHREAGDLQARHKKPNEIDPFRWLFVSFNQLKVRKARKVTVDLLGRVTDPGPPA